MAYNVVMPQLGMTMTEGSVLRWMKEPGEEIAKGEILFEVQTDKVDMEVEAEASGVLTAILVETGKIVPVGTPIALVSSDSADPSQGNGERGTEPPVETTPAPPVTQSVGGSARDAGEVQPAVSREGRRLVSPRARRVAREIGVDLDCVILREGKTRITEGDVRQHEAASAGSAARVATAFEEEPSSARRLIAERMVESVRNVPQFHLTATFDASQLVRLRADLLADIEAQTGVRPTLTDLFATGLARAIAKTPEAMVSWQDGRIVRHQECAIALAVWAGEKLVAPVIRNADRLGFPALVRTRDGLVHKARSGELTLAELEGATCTLSNLGSFRVDHFQAIVTPPQSLVLAVGQVAARPAVLNGSIVVRETVGLTLSVDHRVLDGAAAAKLLETIGALIESPYRLLLSPS